MRQPEAQGDHSGAILDESGRELGRHDGVMGFTDRTTKGDRHRRRSARRSTSSRSTPTSARSPSVRAESLMKRGLSRRASAGLPGTPRIRCARACGSAIAPPAKRRAVTPLSDPGRVRVEFDNPVRSVAPGQAAVFYAGEEVHRRRVDRRGDRVSDDEVRRSSESHDPVFRLMDELGYRFANVELLDQALTHRSYVNECSDPVPRQRALRVSRRRGDRSGRVVGADGALPGGARRSAVEDARARSSAKAALARIAEQARSSAKRCGSGAAKRCRAGAPSLRSCRDAFEALIAAVYLDAGLEQVTQVLLPWFELPRAARAAEVRSEDRAPAAHSSGAAHHADLSSDRRERSGPRQSLRGRAPDRRRREEPRGRPHQERGGAERRGELHCCSATSRAVDPAGSGSPWCARGAARFDDQLRAALRTPFRRRASRSRSSKRSRGSTGTGALFAKLETDQRLDRDPAVRRQSSEHGRELRRSRARLRSSRTQDRSTG